jgi:hypothetical protein
MPTIWGEVWRDVIQTGRNQFRSVYYCFVVDVEQGTQRCIDRDADSPEHLERRLRSAMGIAAA